MDIEGLVIFLVIGALASTSLVAVAKGGDGESGGEQLTVHGVRGSGVGKT